MPIYHASERIHSIRWGASNVQRVYYGSDIVWERFDEFALSLRNNDQVLSYTQGITADYALAGGNPNAYNPGSGVGTEVSVWNRSTYPLVWNRMTVTLTGNNIRIVINRDQARSLNNLVSDWHGTPDDTEIYNWSANRIMHIVNFDNQEQYVLGDTVSPNEVEAVGGGFFRFLVSRSANIDVPNDLESLVFFLRLEESRFFIVCANLNWRAF